MLFQIYIKPTVTADKLMDMFESNVILDIYKTSIIQL